MTTLTIGQLSILQSLREGDNPIFRAPDAELIYFDRDVSHLLCLDLLVGNSNAFTLTAAGRLLAEHDDLIDTLSCRTTSHQTTHHRPPA
jgi:hypothetical protein